MRTNFRIQLLKQHCYTIFCLKDELKLIVGITRKIIVHFNDEINNKLKSFIEH